MSIPEASEAEPAPAGPTAAATSAPCWLKCDFHLHAGEDPLDEIDHSAIDLLHRARALGFGALAITLHGHVLNREEVFAAARELGLLLLPAVEVRLEGADVVLLNVTEEEARGLKRLRDLEALRRVRGNDLFVFAPHPFYLLGGSIGARRLLEHIDLFDAIELCHFHTGFLNPNRGAVRMAERHHKPLLATSDAHRLDFFGAHYARVAVPSATPSTAQLFEALRAGRVENVSPPLPWTRFLRYLWWIFAEHRMRLFQARMAGH